MMLDKEAITHLQSIAVAAAGASKEHTDHGFLMVPPGFKTESLDQFMRCTSHFRESFRTDHIQSFIEYLDSNDAMPCYIDKKGMCAKVIFDAGDIHEPGHRLHQAYLDLTISPLFKSARNMAALHMCSQRDLAEWLEDWRTHLSAESAFGEEIELRKVINAVRNFQVRGKSGSDHSQESLKASKSAFAQIEANNKDHIPEFIIAHGEPYFGLPDIDIAMRLSVRLSTDDEPPMFSLSIVRADHLMNTIAESFAETIRNAIDDGSRVLIGTI